MTLHNNFYSMIEEFCIIGNNIADQKLKCKICNKFIAYYKIKKYNAMHCSRNCANKIIYMQNIQEKKKINMFKKYNVQYVFKSDQIKQKIKQTNLQYYDVENSFQAQQIKQKIKQTNLQRYGAEHIIQIQQFKQQIKYTNLQRYVVEHKKLLNGWNYILSFIQYISPLFTINQFYGLKYEYNWKCNKCGSYFKSVLSKATFLQNNNLYKILRCLNCFPITFGTSIKEKQLRYVKNISKMSLYIIEKLYIHMKQIY